VYLGIAISRWADLNNSICTWNATNNNVRALFSRQAVPMSWDFVELSAFSPIAGFDSVLNSFGELFPSLPVSIRGVAEQADAQNQRISSMKVISTDPPYYDNIGYADLSDFFYVWLRRTLRQVFPQLFSTIAVPKNEELVATPYRHGSKESSETFFLKGMTQAMHSLSKQAHPEPPISIYYAFKQSETDSRSGTSSTGWETFLDAVLQAGFKLTGTWPMRTEREARSVGIGTNSLASSIILVCRKRPDDAPTISRRDFLRELNAVLPEALDEMTKGSGDDRSPVAPVDLSQAIIGPGMAVFSKYAAVLEANGSSMSVHSALQLINRFLAEDDFDPDTQFCLHWFEQNGWKEGRFGDADTLARAKGTSVDGVRDAGVVESGGGIVRLRKWSEYPIDWDPQKDTRLPVWEALHQFIRTLKNEGETSAGSLLVAVKGKSEATRQLAYRLHTLCERQGWAEDARAYNELITSWSGIEAAASAVPMEKTQGRLFE
jgi:putative DNA methylase